VSVAIRPVRAEELVTAQRLDAQIFGDLFTKLTGQSIDLPLRELDYFWHWKRTDPEGALVAETDEGIVGINFCHARGKMGWFGPLGVATHAQGQGIGKKLLRAGIRYLEGAGCDVIGLDTFANNPVSVNLYLSAGFNILNAHVQLQADREVLRRLNPNGRPSELRLTPVAEDALGPLVEMELGVSGFDRRPDFEFLLRWEKSGGFKLTEDGQLAGYAFYLLKRGAGNIACVYAKADETPNAVRWLLCACAEALGKTGRECVSVLTTGENRCMINLLLNYGFRAKRTMIRMYRGLDGVSAASYCPLASEKG